MEVDINQIMRVFLDRYFKILFTALEHRRTACRAGLEPTAGGGGRRGEDAPQSSPWQPRSARRGAVCPTRRSVARCIVGRGRWPPPGRAAKKSRAAGAAGRFYPPLPAARSCLASHRSARGRPEREGARSRHGPDAVSAAASAGPAGLKARGEARAPPAARRSAGPPSALGRPRPAPPSSARRDPAASRAGGCRSFSVRSSRLDGIRAAAVAPPGAGGGG